MPLERITQTALARELSKEGRGKRFMLFLGAGASKTSGVLLAQEMIGRWRRRQMVEGMQVGPSQTTPPPNSVGHVQGDEFGRVLSELFPSDLQRRDALEEAGKDASPSIGYLYLVRLMERAGLFQTVFTTNFDNLVIEACFSFSNVVRPIVYAHEANVGMAQLDRPRPRVIKLHGDWQYADIRAASNQTWRLGPMMESKWREFAKQGGMVVVGYAGLEDSIMTPLSGMIDAGEFPYGVYWCVRDGKVPPALERFSKRQDLQVVDIAGFDELLAETHRRAGLDPVSALFKPSRAQAMLLDRLRIPKKSHEGGSHLQDDIRDLEALVPRGEAADPTERPLRLLLELAERNGDAAAILRAQLQLLKHRPTMVLFDAAFWNLAQNASIAGVAKYKKQLLECFKASQIALGQLLVVSWNVAMALVSMGDYAGAKDILEWAKQTSVSYGGKLDASKQRINECFVKLLLARSPRGKQSGAPGLSPDELAELSGYAEDLNETVDVRMGASILLESWADATKFFKAAVDKQSIPTNWIPKFPILALLRGKVKDHKLNKLLATVIFQPAGKERADIAVKIKRRARKSSGSRAEVQSTPRRGKPPIIGDLDEKGIATDR